MMYTHAKNITTTPNSDNQPGANRNASAPLTATRTAALPLILLTVNLVECANEPEFGGSPGPAQTILAQVGAEKLEFLLERNDQFLVGQRSEADDAESAGLLRLNDDPRSALPHLVNVERVCGTARGIGLATICPAETADMPARPAATSCLSAGRPDTNPSVGNGGHSTAAMTDEGGAGRPDSGGGGEAAQPVTPAHDSSITVANTAGNILLISGQSSASACQRRPGAEPAPLLPASTTATALP